MSSSPKVQQMLLVLGAASSAATANHVIHSHDREDYEKVMQHAYEEAWQHAEEEKREREVGEVVLEGAVARIEAVPPPRDAEQKHQLAVAADATHSLSVYTDDPKLLEKIQQHREQAHRAMQTDTKAARLYTENATAEERQASVRLAQQAKLSKGVKLR